MDVDIRRDDAVGVIQCASKKRTDAGHFVADDDRKVMFVADPAAAPPNPSLRYAKPDDATPAGHTCRERLERYNRESRSDNPWGLLPAWRLYVPKQYGKLVDALGVGNVFILSAGWGLIAAEYLLPNYDITFSASARGADAYKRRRLGDQRYRDFRMLPQGTTKHVFFFGGKDYLPLFCALTAGIRRRTAFVNSRSLPKGINCRTERYETTAKTNWHYGCVDAFVDRRVKTPAAKRIADTVRFYDLLGQLEGALGGARTLAACDGSMGWPQRGVYFFFEPGETRSLSGSGSRVVRIGTHALKAKSRATLWNRLSQHRGTADGGSGNHRGSIFRLLIGIALTRRGDCERPGSWGVGADARTAAHRLGTSPEAIKEAERGLERRVSAYVGQLPFLWLEVPDAAGPDSERGRIERNAIALLSHARSAAADAPSAQWLGAHSDRPLVRAAGLWNNNHAEEDYDDAFLDALTTLARSRNPARG